MRLKINADETSYGSTGGAVYCPHCGSCTDMHPIGIEVFMPDKEGGTEGIYTLIKNDCDFVVSKKIPDTREGARRQSFHITFACSDCDAVSRLAINQHKGPTFFYWER